MNEDNDQPVEIDFLDAARILDTFQQFRLKRPDDRLAWEDVRTLISAGLVVAQENQETALRWSRVYENERKARESALEEIQQAEFFRRPK